MRASMGFTSSRKSETSCMKCYTRVTTTNCDRTLVENNLQLFCGSMTPCALTWFVLLFAATFEAYIMWSRLPYYFTDNQNAYKTRWVNGAGKSIKSQTTDFSKYSHNRKNLRLTETNQDRKNLDKTSLRVYQGTSIDSHEYPYVVILTTMQEFVIQSKPRVLFLRYCTGSLISQEWVLSAAHCIENPMIVKESWIFYGDVENINKNSSTKSKVIKGIPHPSYLTIKDVKVDSNEHWQWAFRNDIGLLHVDKIELKHLGKLSAADYMSMIGYSVTYVGGGTSNSEFKNETRKEALKINVKDLKRPLQVGEAVVVRCDSYDKAGVVASYICLRPKCSMKLQQVRAGDSGGPLLRRGKIIGICSAGVPNRYVTFYTAISPYLDWLHLTMLSHKKL